MNRLIEIFEGKYPSSNYFICRLQRLYLRLKLLYLGYILGYLTIKYFFVGLYVDIPCHMIAFRDWIMYGTISEAYLEWLEENQR